MRQKKKALRSAVKAAVATGAMRIDENALAGRIEALPEFAAARTVALYDALPDEIPTAGMLRRWHGVKRLALPAISDGGEMVFGEYTGDEGLAAGTFGIREPRAGRGIPPEGIDLMIVPGMAFDGAGRRLGRGKGFYDRYLSSPAAAHIYKVGVCPLHALAEEVPAEPHDVKMDEIILIC